MEADVHAVITAVPDPCVVAQVGSVSVEEGLWARPEDMTQTRPTCYATITKPGTEVCSWQPLELVLPAWPPCSCQQHHFLLKASHHHGVHRSDGIIPAAAQLWLTQEERRGRCLQAGMHLST